MRALENNTWEKVNFPGKMPVGCKWVFMEKFNSNGSLERYKASGDLEVFMDAPSSFEESFGTKVCKLRKSLYGLKQSARSWFERFTRSVKIQGYSQGQTDLTMFVKLTGRGKITILIVYVDVIIPT
ncbi:Retrovirus-related Pol polyprotein from transposon TNT 1-94 [Vitis vinifera]|uniref:Retrovirus-related Pol polyprotein from transposon TNT 1-94 n=1 Tax=Vitis vinifera TaxID=29760 RepID=A0A438H4U6_VITVI|nr:Retrovirus-related Pol polyprotein from transposon TNT 1-94 [Vitis vinifera]